MSTGALAAAGIAQATVMRPTPGFSAAGPQGTRAMLRSDLEKVIESAQPPPPTGPQPVPQPGPPPPRGRTPAGTCCWPSRACWCSPSRAG
ncbi:hypothetical protein ACFQV2_09665 [Actinokineospora soli]|uniref:Uncharacterized protein n=1 Tax=Actinokineospora soli TaxID=1048753 RepID=A0ABW2TJB5_9PSEU